MGGVGDRRRERRGRKKAYAGDRLETLAVFVLTVPGTQVFFQLGNLLVDFGHLPCKGFEGSVRERRKTVRFGHLAVLEQFGD